MTLPPSPMLARLEAALVAAVHPVERACARAELAGFQARQGLFDEATQALTSLRSEFAQALMQFDVAPERTRSSSAVVLHSAHVSA